MSKGKIKVAILDNSPVIIHGIRTIISRYDDLELAGVYLNYPDLIKGFIETIPDILIAEFEAKGANAGEIMLQIRKDYPRTGLIIFTIHEDIRYVKLMMRNGASGYLLKSSQEADIINGIRSVYKGEQSIDENIKEAIFQKAQLNKRLVTGLPVFSVREREILQLMASNNTSKEISKKLFISKKTVENHRSNMLLKFKVKNATTLVKKAIDLDLLEE